MAEPAADWRERAADGGREIHVELAAFHVKHCMRGSAKCSSGRSDPAGCPVFLVAFIWSLQGGPWTSNGQEGKKVVTTNRR